MSFSGSFCLFPQSATTRGPEAWVGREMLRSSQGGFLDVLRLFRRVCITAQVGHEHDIEHGQRHAISSCFHVVEIFVRICIWSRVVFSCIDFSYLLVSCIVLSCLALWFIVLLWPAFSCLVLHRVVLSRLDLCCRALRFIVLAILVLSWIVLRCSVVSWNVLA